MTDQEREEALISQMCASIKSEIRDMYLKYGEFDTPVVYTALCMELCSLAVSDGMPVHALLEGVLKTYREMEKRNEHQDLNQAGE